MDNYSTHHFERKNPQKRLAMQAKHKPHRRPAPGAHIPIDSDKQQRKPRFKLPEIHNASKERHTQEAPASHVKSQHKPAAGHVSTHRPKVARPQKLKKPLSGLSLTTPKAFKTSSAHQGFTRRTFLKIAAGGAVIAGTYGIWSWVTSIKITVNGQEMTVPSSTTIDGLISKLGLTPKRGNYVSVSGKILKENEGWEWVAYRNNEVYHPGDDFTLKAGDNITIKDGDNKLEPHDVTYEEQQPHMKFAGEPWGAIHYISQWPQAGKKEILKGKETGETAPGKEVSKLQDCIVTTARVRPKGGEKLVALTFDDGPSEFTQKYLDILAEKGVHATFFQLGVNIKRYPDMEKKILDAGHQIASHTWDHKDLVTLNKEGVQEELSQNKKMIKEKAGIDTTMLRPPYGSFNNKCWWEAEGLCTSSIMWTHDTLDWKQPGADAIKAAAIKALAPGSIILMHDGGGPRGQDVEALPGIIDEIKNQGFELVTIAELLGSDPNFPKDIANGTAEKPKDCQWPATDEPAKE